MGMFLILLTHLAISLDGPLCWGEAQRRKWYYENTGAQVEWPTLKIHYGGWFSSTAMNTMAYMLIREQLGFPAEFYPELDPEMVNEWTPYWEYHSSKVDYIQDFRDWVDEGLVDLFYNVQLTQLEQIFLQSEQEAVELSVYTYGLSEFNGMILPVWANLEPKSQNLEILDHLSVFQDEVLWSATIKNESTGRAQILNSRAEFQYARYLNNFLQYYNLTDRWEVWNVGSAEALLGLGLRLTATQTPFVAAAQFPSEASAYLELLQRRHYDPCPPRFDHPDPTYNYSYPNPTTGIGARCYTKVWVPEPRSGHHTDPCIMEGRCHVPEWQSVGFTTFKASKYTDHDSRKIEVWKDAIKNLLNFIKITRAEMQAISDELSFTWGFDGNTDDIFGPICKLLKENTWIWEDGITKDIIVMEFQEDTIPDSVKLMFTISAAICIAILAGLLVGLCYAWRVLHVDQVRKFAGSLSSIWICGCIANLGCVFYIVGEYTKSSCIEYQWLRHLSGAIIFVIPALRAWRIASIFSGKMNLNNDVMVKTWHMFSVLGFVLASEISLLTIFSQHVIVTRYEYEDDYLYDYDCAMDDTTVASLTYRALIALKMFYVFAIIYFAWKSRRAWSEYRETSWLMILSFSVLAIMAFYIVILMDSYITTQEYIRLILAYIFGFVIPISYFAQYVYVYMKNIHKEHKLDDLAMESGIAENIMLRLEKMPLKQVEWFDRQYNRFLMHLYLDGELKDAGLELQQTVMKRGVDRADSEHVPEMIRSSDPNHSSHNLWHKFGGMIGFGGSPEQSEDKHTFVDEVEEVPLRPSSPTPNEAQGTPTRADSRCSFSKTQTQRLNEAWSDKSREGGFEAQSPKKKDTEVEKFAVGTKTQKSIHF